MTRVAGSVLSVLVLLAPVPGGRVLAEDDPSAMTGQGAKKLLEAGTFRFEVTLKLVLEKESHEMESRYRGVHAADGTTHLEGDIMGSPIDWYTRGGKIAARDPASGGWSQVDSASAAAMNPVDLLERADTWIPSAQWIDDVDVGGVPCRRAAGVTMIVPGGFEPPPGVEGGVPEIQANQMECAIGKEDGVLRGFRTIAKYDAGETGTILVMSQVEFRDVGQAVKIDVPAEVRPLLGLEPGGEEGR